MTNEGRLTSVINSQHEKLKSVESTLIIHTKPIRGSISELWSISLWFKTKIIVSMKETFNVIEGAPLVGRRNLLSFVDQMMSLILKNLIFECLNLLESQKISRKYLFRKECSHKLIRLSIKSTQGAMIEFNLI